MKVSMFGPVTEQGVIGTVTANMSQQADGALSTHFVAHGDIPNRTLID